MDRSHRPRIVARTVAAALLVGALLGTLLGACAGTNAPTGTPAYTITRSWSNGYEEIGKIYQDGRTTMQHGSHEERLVVPAYQMAELAAAAARGVTPGSNADDPIVGVTIGDGATVRPAALGEGSLAALLNLLLDSHTLHP